MASLSDILIKVGVDQKGLNKGLLSMERNLKRFGRRASAIGRNIGTGITLPMVGIATAGVKEYMALEESLTKINTLVGISAEEVNKSAKAIRTLSVEVGKSQVELADALYFIQSADPSRTSAEALKILERVSKASAIGLGETKDVANAVTSVMEAYGDETYTAAQATDILTKAVEQGKMEASEFSPALGRVIGIGAELGLTFEEVAANVAMYTRAGVSAEEATTGLRGVLNTLIKATPQMKDRLNELNIPIEEVRKSLKERGLVATLGMLMEAFDGNLDAMGDVFANVRALANVTFTAGKAFDDYQEVLSQVNANLGKVDQGFDHTRKQTFHKFRQSIVNIQNSLIDFAGMVMPLFELLLRGINNALSAIQNLDSETKKQILTTAGWTMGIGALLFALGKVAPAIGIVVKSFRKLLRIKITPFTLAMAGLAVLGVYVYNNWEKVRGAIVKVVNYVIDLYNEFFLVRLLVHEALAVFQSIGDIMMFLWQSTKNWGRTFADVLSSIVKGPKGWKELPNVLLDGFKGQLAEWVIMGENIGERLKKGIEDAATAKRVKLITEDDVQASVDSFINKYKSGMISAKEFMESLFTAGGGPSVIGGDSSSSSISGYDPSAVTEMLKESEKELRDFYSGPVTKTRSGLIDMWNIYGKFMLSGGQFPVIAIMDELGEAIERSNQKWERSIEKIELIKDLMSEIANITQSIFDRRVQKIEETYEAEKRVIEHSAMDEEKKAEKIERLEARKNKKVAKEKRRAAIAEKAFNIAQSIMNTSVAITSALKNPATAPFVIPLIKAIGIAQVAAIIAQPIPKFAKGGIVSGPTLGLMGEYPGARSNPEVVAPLSKLRSIMGLGENHIMMSGEFRIDGNDLALSLERTNRQRNRRVIYGT